MSAVEYQPLCSLTPADISGAYPQEESISARSQPAHLAARRYLPWECRYSNTLSLPVVLPPVVAALQDTLLGDEPQRERGPAVTAPVLHGAPLTVTPPPHGQLLAQQVNHKRLVVVWQVVGGLDRVPVLLPVERLTVICRGWRRFDAILTRRRFSGGR